MHIKKLNKPSQFCLTTQKHQFKKIPAFSSAQYLQQALKYDASFESRILISHSKLERNLVQSLEADNSSGYIPLPFSLLGIWVIICGC